MDSISLQALGKYGLLLIIFYGIEIVVTYFIDFAIPKLFDSDIGIVFTPIPIIVMYLLNIITAFIVNKDKKRFRIDGKYSVLLTIFYRPIGVVLFILYLINMELNKMPAHNKG